ncbi:hypothetical protein BAUCODRAFT_73528 [Baudoinia panamericana UAMH 10762]|uniref:Helix-turn-helix domain-containing protein n=1 Tax=Baudoinia panamericana (strain UAMH 10762) TaxID=717646 RepID=M2MDM9_BAUPA|nr:uncharacterized protein BAUCODRAFT_73528 [Baudoinia panamericana UAMH 10762]EMC94656.1 hypothetical protein BAUCODRAFT_73528 [Baudoinia panamericana UAMH 10762]
MGSSTSKAARATGSAARRYPSRTSPSTSTNAPPRRPPPAPEHRPGPTVRPQPQVSTTRDEAINLDASDPAFARSLRSIGPVQPNPTLSPSSAFPQPNNSNNPSQAPRPAGPDPRRNPALAVLDARARLQDQADKELQQAGRRGHEGRQFLDVFMIREILVQRDEKGKSAAEIERGMGLRSGVVERLGPAGMVGVAQEQGRAQKGVDMV